METHLLGHAIDAMRRHTGVVIPVYFPADADPGLGQALLADNVRAYVQQVDDPARICLSVDGAEHGMEIAEALAAECGVVAVCTPDNMGKMNGLRHGVRALWEREKREELRYVAAVDSDGDHFANELLNLVRAAVHVQEREGGEVLALGRRSSKHRPMGFLRGELEELADRVLLDALAFRAAKSGEPLRMEYATTHEEYPDFHSGFKLYSRGVVEPVFLGEPELCALEPAAYYRHACEAVAVVEALLAGARLALVARSTFNEQPVSAFGQYNRERLVADKIIWPCKRLGVPAPFVEQWLRNHLPRLLLNTLVPEGKQELLQIRRLVLQAFELPEDELSWGPLFV
jgi:hypothetical protein